MKNYKTVTQSVYINKYNPCNLKLWLIYLFTIIFPFIQKIYDKKVKCHFNKNLLLLARTYFHSRFLSSNVLYFSSYITRICKKNTVSFKQGGSNVYSILQLGITARTPADFLAKAKEIVMRHKELEMQLANLQTTVTSLETEQEKLVHTSSHLFFT